MVNVALVSCAGNGGIMNGQFTVVNFSLSFKKQGLSMVYLNYVCFGIKLKTAKVTFDFIVTMATA